MKKYIALIFISFFCIFLTGCTNKEKDLNDLDIIKNRGYIIVGVKSDSPPFGYYKNKKLVGIDIDIAKEISRTIFNDSSPDKIHFIPLSAQKRITTLNSKEIDMLVATMSINDTRRLVMDFSIPYFAAGQKIMVRKNSDISYLQYFNKKGRIAVIMGTTGEKIIRLIAPNANVAGAKTYNEAVNLLRNKQVDAILGDDCILASYNDGKFKIENRIYSKEYYAVAIRKSQNSKELLNVINAAITEYLDKKKSKNLKKV